MAGDVRGALGRRREGTRLASLPSERREAFLNEGNLAVVDRLRTFAAGRGRGVLDVALAWLAAQPTVASVIAGATKPEQVEANAAAVGWQLDDDELAQIDGITTPA